MLEARLSQAQLVLVHEITKEDGVAMQRKAIVNNLCSCLALKTPWPGIAMSWLQFDNTLLLLLLLCAYKMPLHMDCY